MSISEQVKSSGTKQVHKERVLSAEIIVTDTADKPYYEIKYFDLSDMRYHIGYSSYDLNIVFGYLEKYFEIVKENKCDTIAEQTTSLRDLAEMQDAEYKKRIINKAADAIESLSAKLEAANMERQERYYNGDIFTEILENLNNRIRTQLKIMAELNDETQKYGYAKALDAYQQIKTYIEITLEEYKEKQLVTDCGGGWIKCIERLPDKEVLCCDKDKNMIFGYVFVDEESETGFSAENDHEFMYNCVKWMEKPKP